VESSSLTQSKNGAPERLRKDPCWRTTGRKQGTLIVTSKNNSGKEHQKRSTGAEKSQIKAHQRATYGSLQASTVGNKPARPRKEKKRIDHLLKGRDPKQLLTGFCKGPTGPVDKKNSNAPPATPWDKSARLWRKKQRGLPTGERRRLAF